MTGEITYFHNGICTVRKRKNSNKLTERSRTVWPDNAIATVPWKKMDFSAFENYEVEGQLSLFESPEFSQEESTTKCKMVNECEAYPQGCGGTIEPCRFGGPYKWSEVMP